jgi:hypothetical protein
MVTWLRLVGWDAQQLAGGYKAFRGHVIAQLEQQVPRLHLRVLCGATGSAKTRVLHALQAQGAQVWTWRAWPATKDRCWEACLASSSPAKSISTPCCTPSWHSWI